MAFTLPEGIVLSKEFTQEDLRLGLAILLHARGDISIGKAAEISGLRYRDYWDRLVALDLPVIRYTEEMWEQDLRYLNRKKEDKAN